MGRNTCTCRSQLGKACSRSSLWSFVAPLHAAHAPCVLVVQIDHGYTLPSSFADVCFEWLYWPQARAPFDAATRAYIAALDADADLATLEVQLSSLRQLVHIVLDSVRTVCFSSFLISHHIMSRCSQT